MRILVISNCPLVEFHGSGYVIMNYARGLQALGHEVDLLGPESCEFLPKLRKARARRLSIGIAIRAVRQVLKKRYDIIEMYGAESWLAASVLSRWPRRMFLLVTHSNGLETHFSVVSRRYLGSDSLDGSPLKWYQRLLNRPLKRAFTKVDALVTVSGSDKNYAVSERYQRSDRVLAIDNPLPEIFLRQPVAFQRSKIIGFCGSWLPNKGIATIQKDIGKILNEFPDTRFKIIGGTNFRLEEWFSPKQCEQIDVVGFIESKEVLKAIYSEISILIAPSIYEGFGLTIAEGMACGCAVVATRTGYAASLESGCDILLMEEPQSPFLYECVRSLLLDDKLRVTIAHGGYSRVQNLRWPDAIQKLSSKYRAWLDEFRSGRSFSNR